MRFSLENIGKIRKADIDLNGITVICGDNNTGKSTIGKALFCVFNSCYDIDNTIILQLTIRTINDINRKIRTSLLNVISNEERLTVENVASRRFRLACTIEDFFKFSEELSDNYEEGKKQIDSFLESKLFSKYYQLISNSDELYKEIYDLIKSTLKEPIEPHKLTRVKSFFYTVFDEQPININSDKAFVSTLIQGKNFKFYLDENSKSSLSLDIEFNNHAIFIDSPDEYKLNATDWIPDYPNRNTLKNLVQNEMIDQSDDVSATADVNRTIIEKRLSVVTNILNRAIKGRFKRNSDKNEKEFEFDGTDSTISISNLSTGVKSLLLFRTLCECGKLSPKDVLILDEPEIHLHPDWQLVYAEALVVLQKELDLTILITSHSPAFVRAIECYCDYYDCMEKLDVYHTKRIDNSEYTLENLSYMNYGVSELYDEFSKPFSDLDEMLKEKYNKR